MREAMRWRPGLAVRVMVAIQGVACDRAPTLANSAAPGTAEVIPPIQSAAVLTAADPSGKLEATGAATAPVGSVTLDTFDLERHAELLKTLPIPARECVPLGPDVQAYGATPEDCVYDVALENLYDSTRCAADDDYCPAGVGAYLGRLVRLREVNFTVTEDEPPERCHSRRCEDAPSSWCCWKMSSRSGSYPCSGAWWGQVGVASAEKESSKRQVLPLVSAGGYNEVTCGRGWVNGTKFVPDMAQRPPRCQPICPAWVWKKHTVVVRPTGIGLKLVVPPKGIDPKYLLSEDPLP
jgi:hypothetical protein